MIDASDPEFIRLLARLKLSVRRQLEYNIDLARLQKDAQQALEVLKEIEDMAEDGALILRLPNGERQMIRAGDVSLIGRT